MKNLLLFLAAILLSAGNAAAYELVKVAGALKIDGIAETAWQQAIAKTAESRRQAGDVLDADGVTKEVVADWIGKNLYNGKFVQAVVSGKATSWLARESEVHLLAAIEEEGGPMNRAPRDSILAEMLVLQALSILLQSEAAVSPQQYVKWHPGGSLGKLREGE